MNNNTEQAGANAPGFRCGMFFIEKELDKKNEQLKLESPNRIRIQFTDNSLDNVNDEKNFFTGRAEEINGDIISSKFGENIIKDLESQFERRSTEYAGLIRKMRNQANSIDNQRGVIN